MKQKSARGYPTWDTEEPARLKYTEGGSEEPEDENKASRNENIKYRKPSWLREAAYQEELANRDPTKEHKERR